MRRGLIALGIAMLAAAMLLVGALGPVGSAPGGGSGDGPAVASAAPGRSPTSIGSLQLHLRAVPGDWVGWAALGLAYVQQAKITADPAYYAKAEGVLRRSRKIKGTDNFAAAAGLAALAAGRHDFGTALDWARRGLAVNPSSATLYGALDDALTQLGRYPEAFQATQRMVDLAPGTSSLARASYAWELRGNLEEARTDMNRALQDAVTPADRAFARYYLGELALNAGDAGGALAQHQAGLQADPAYVPLLEGRAKAEAALGQTEAAVADYTAAVAAVPQPSYVIELGELLQSLGRGEEADQQYRLFATESKLFEVNKVALDIEPALFYADHGDPRRALRYARAGIDKRTFVEMDDAYAWALHANGRDAEALDWSQRALALGTRNALFHYHAGMIRQALGQAREAAGELRTALEINPHFSPLGAPAARQALDRMSRP